MSGRGRGNRRRRIRRRRGGEADGHQQPEKFVLTCSDDEDMQLQEALYQSALMFRKEDETLEAMKRKGKEICSSVEIISGVSSSNWETGECSYGVCEICDDKISSEEILTNRNCDHSFCSDCLHSYLGKKVQASVTRVKCPESNCKRRFPPEHFRHFVPRKAYQVWKHSINEARDLAETDSLDSPPGLLPYILGGRGKRHSEWISLLAICITEVMC
ncbi:hypothetical protein RJ639_008250 [Escallonia herrerae]|uniref:RBR-type E3 ubiquitin transferase n=1 Tax=Escallonia herrerae TaxID=1293975 RepID=A0AA89AQJ2_9ASTE|nr:hypothetical protein RJ639_008250 [Escallonia herrerae]